MPSLTPLETVPDFTESIRTLLNDYWITSVEEFVSTATSANAQLGSGLGALAQVLGLPEDTAMALVQAGQAALPPDMAFPAEVELAIGTGAIFDGMEPLPEAAFDLPLDLPSEKNLADSLRAPRNQGQRNTCVAFTLAAMVEQVTGQPDLLSPQFIYWACKEQDGIPGDVGTRPDIGMKVLEQLGICGESVWSYDPVRNDSNPGQGPPPPGAEAEARNSRVASSTQLLPGDVLRIKATIATGSALLIGMPVSEHWTNTWQARALGRVRKPLPGEASGGGHALLAVGYRDDPAAPGGGYFIVRNSWGLGWGRENLDGAGYGHIPYQLVAECNQAAFTITAMASATLDIVTPEPAVVPSGIGSIGAPGQRDLQALVQEAQRLAAGAARDLARVDALLRELGAALGQSSTHTHGTPPEVPPAAPPMTHTRRWTGPLILVHSDAEASQELLTPNGILATTGEPLLTIDAASASALARADISAKKAENPAYYLHRARVAAGEKTMGTTFGEENDIRKAGWAVVVNADDDATLLKALSPLIVKRCVDQGLAVPPLEFRAGETCGAWLVRTVADPRAPLKSGVPVLVYRSGEDAATFLARHGTSQGPVDPGRGVPFYLLLAGRPGPNSSDDTAFLPFLLQYELDIFWGVGRLCFTNPTTGQHDYAAYAAYAEQVVAFEQAAAPPYGKHIAYFGTRHAFDRSTQRSADELLIPLTEGQSGQPAVAARFGFTQQRFLAEQATRDAFDRLLRGEAEGGRPALLFTATHGIGFPADDSRLNAEQGALICQDWTGYGNIKREHWYAGADLPAQTRVDGLVAVCFACYSIGCPAEDQFVFEPGKERPAIAPYPLVAHLPQQLLARGGLAVLGHVERAWTHSFSAPGVHGQTQRFESVLGRLMQGDRLGLATDQFNMVQGALAMQLAQRLEDVRFGYNITAAELSALWVARNDARNYAVLGDPAVRLPLSRSSDA